MALVEAAGLSLDIVEGRDSKLVEKLINLLKWLDTLPPLKENPALIKTLSQFKDLDSIRKFKKWYVDTIRPDLYDPKAVSEKLLIDYGLFIKDFSLEDGNKFVQYILCFNDFIKKNE